MPTDTSPNELPYVASPASVPERRGRRRRRAGLIAVVLDVWLIVAFLIDESFRWTGLGIHEWIGLILGGALVVHLALHWDWLSRTATMFRRRGRNRTKWLLDVALLIGMTLCVASGVAISQSALPAVGLHPAGNQFWVWLHWTTSSACLVLVAVHVARNRQWISSTGRRMIRRSSPSGPTEP